MTHGLGILFGVVALVDLLQIAYFKNNVLMAACFAAYGLSLIVLYTASTFYHLSRDPETKLLLKKVDHTSIYFLIAGSYTPFLLLSVGGPLGQWFCLGVWLAAVMGAIAKFKFTFKRVKLSVLLYIFMGWAVVFIWRDLVAAIPTSALYWLITGGLLYTLGTVFYLMKRMKHHHMIWHLFVLAGSVGQYLAVRISAVS